MKHWLIVLLLAGCAGPGSLQEGPASTTQLLCDQLCEVMVSERNVNEFSIAVHPTDPLTAIITANDYDAGYYPVGPTEHRWHGLWGSIWTTHDGGANWEHQFVEGRFLENSPLWGQDYLGDMVVTYGDDGVAYIAGIAYSNTPTTGHKLFVMRSMDGDVWEEPAIIDLHLWSREFHDKPAILVTNDRIVLVWNYNEGLPPRDLSGSAGNDMKWAVSRDWGNTWEIGEFSDAGSGISASLAQAPDGTIHAVYRTYSPLAIMHRSSPNGMTWSEPTQVLSISSASIDTPNANYRTFVVPDLAITSNGTLYSIVADKDDDGFGQVLVSTSQDGASWNTTRIDGGPDERGRFLAAMGSDNDTVVATWLDRGHDTNDESYHLVAATLQDGAWNRTQITSAESPPGSAFFIGDYMEVDVVGNDVYMAWPDLRNDRIDLYAGHWNIVESMA